MSFDNAAREALIGIILVVVGVAIAIAINPQNVMLLTIFFGLAILSFFLRIKYCEEKKDTPDVDFPGLYNCDGRPKETWNTRYPVPYFILMATTFMIGVAAVWPNEPIDFYVSTIHLGPIFMILFGLSDQLPALFKKVVINARK